MAENADVRDLPAVGRRWIAVGMRRMGHEPAAVRKATGIARQQQDKWLQTFAATNDVQNDPMQGRRTDRQEAIGRTKETVKQMVDEGHRDA